MGITYVEPAWSPKRADWIAVRTHEFATIGGVPRLIVPDNAKIAVIKACSGIREIFEQLREEKSA